MKLTGSRTPTPDDIDILLVRPGASANATVMSDAGGSLDVNAVDLTLDDEAAAALPDAAQIATGSYQPANYEGADPFPAPAPAPSGSVALFHLRRRGTQRHLEPVPGRRRRAGPERLGHELVAVDHDLRRPTASTTATATSAPAATATASAAASSSATTSTSASATSASASATTTSASPTTSASTAAAASTTTSATTSAAATTASGTLPRATADRTEARCRKTADPQGQSPRRQGAPRSLQASAAAASRRSRPESRSDRGPGFPVNLLVGRR